MWLWVGGRVQGCGDRCNVAPLCVNAATVNGDGWVDIVLVLDSGAVTWYRHSGEETPSFFPEVLSSDSQLGVAALPVPGLVADIDRDGKAGQCRPLAYAACIRYSSHSALWHRVLLIGLYFRPWPCL